MRRAPLIAALLIAVAPVVTQADGKTAIKRAKSGQFDAQGEVRCAQEVGQALGTCDASVARVAGSTAVVVTFPNSFARILTFSDGAFLRGNATMSGVGTDTEWQLTNGTYHIRVDDQRFELPETLVFPD
ncbi:hypothetical protein GCM10007385_10050 [Tateyamaria omphalii]|uniref:hypothetical protein n=1 Tax=Tateyamaria omphalii TaxID=299262 RepID=UPI001672AAA2|nr:hypothetical protein [Tateyamaria omphalii]GGX44096.1 hypothetical protein GCM10007385_10050 [Tateyamaria omphalii]